DLFQILKAFDVRLKGLAPRSRTCRRDCISCLNQDRFNALCLLVSVMSADGIYDYRGFSVFACQASAYGNVRPLHLVVSGLSYVMEQSCTLSYGNVGSNL